MTDKHEQRARRAIDANLEAAGWLVQDFNGFDFSAGETVNALTFKLDYLAGAGQSGGNVIFFETESQEVRSAPDTHSRPRRGAQ